MWVCDLPTNQHFTLKQKPIQRSDFDEFVGCCRPGAMHNRKPTRSEDNPSLDLFWIKDKSLTDTGSLPAPEIVAAGIADDLEAPARSPGRAHLSLSYRRSSAFIRGQIALFGAPRPN